MWKRGVASLLLLGALIVGGRYFATSMQQAGGPEGAARTNPPSLITEPDQGIAPILSLISSASSSVDVVMYQFEDPQIEQALAQDAARGVKVRVILNGGYYGKKENDDNDDAYTYFQSHGVQVHWSPASFALTHQKSVVVDDKEALIMTLNFTPQYYASSRDFAVLDTDQNDVSAIEQTFDADWNDQEIGAQNGDDLVWSPGSQQTLLDLIDSATSSLDIYNEEMAGPAITDALSRAAGRGVAVRVVMTDSTEWHRAFEQLTQAGAEVRTYAPNASLYIHAKVIVADDSKAFIGSENFSSGSLQDNRELGIIVSDPTIISSLEQTFNTDFSRAVPF